jgi:hypothetical protein
MPRTQARLQCDVPAPNTGFIAIAAGNAHSLGLKSDGSIVAWGCGGDANVGQCDIPAPNRGYTALAAGLWHSLAIRGCHPERAGHRCRLDLLPQPLRRGRPYANRDSSPRRRS